MKKTLFLVHDPGGYDVVFPVVERFDEAGSELEFYCAGPSALLNANYGLQEQLIKKKLHKHIEEQTIQMLVTGTSWGSSLELEAIKRCREAGIVAVSILDYWSNYSFRFFNMSHSESIYPDFYIVMDELASKEAIAEGVPERIIRVLGQPGLDRFLQLKLHKKRQPSERKKVLLLSQPLSGLYGSGLGYTEHQVIEDCIQAIINHKHWTLDIKFHPKDHESLQKSFGELAIQGTKSLLNILPEYDLVIGMNSIGLLHAVLMGIPAISYQPNLQKTDLCIINKLGFTRAIKNYNDLTVELDAVSRRPNVVMTEDMKKKHLWLDGGSTERVVRFLREVIKDGEN